LFYTKTTLFNISYGEPRRNTKFPIFLYFFHIYFTSIRYDEAP
jgi:hypothetical protein